MKFNEAIEILINEATYANIRNFLVKRIDYEDKLTDTQVRTLIDSLLSPTAAKELSDLDRANDIARLINRMIEKRLLTPEQKEAISNAFQNARKGVPAKASEYAEKQKEKEQQDIEYRKNLYKLRQQGKIPHNPKVDLEKKKK